MEGCEEQENQWEGEGVGSGKQAVKRVAWAAVGAWHVLLTANTF